MAVATADPTRVLRQVFARESDPGWDRVEELCEVYRAADEIRELQQRLERVQRRGGRFKGVTFSPHARRLKGLLEKQIAIPLAGLRDIAPLVEHYGRGRTVFEPGELLRISETLAACGTIRRFLKGLEECVRCFLSHPVGFMKESDFGSSLVGTAIEFTYEVTGFLYRNNPHFSRGS